MYIHSFEMNRREFNVTMMRKSTVDWSASSTMSANRETKALPSITLRMTLQTLTCMYISLYLGYQCIHVSLIIV